MEFTIITLNKNYPLLNLLIKTLESKNRNNKRTSTGHANEKPLKPNASRLSMRGEIVEVQGGHIVRSTGRKDRHSKVCTAKGPRDRRVRLSAHTAIQFYDVQDRLGYDRPSKAVDWLITKARAAIDELAELPPWNPTGEPETEQNETNLVNATSSSSYIGPDGIGNVNVKSFFPMGEPGNDDNNTGIQNYPNQDLRLSLQSFDNPIFSVPQPANQDILGFDHGSSGTWADFQRMVGWNSGDSSAGSGMYNTGTPVQQAPLVFGNQFVSQRGPLQSSCSYPSIRAWIDHPTPQPMGYIEQSSFPVHYHQHMGAFSGFSGFRVPARIQGDEEEHDGISDKPSSASSDSLSRH